MDKYFSPAGDLEPKKSEVSNSRISSTMNKEVNEPSIVDKINKALRTDSIDINCEMVQENLFGGGSMIVTKQDFEMMVTDMINDEKFNYIFKKIEMLNPEIVDISYVKFKMKEHNNNNKSL